MTYANSRFTTAARPISVSDSTPHAAKIREILNLVGASERVLLETLDNQVEPFRGEERQAAEERKKALLRIAHEEIPAMLGLNWLSRKAQKAKDLWSYFRVKADTADYVHAQDFLRDLAAKPLPILRLPLGILPIDTRIQIVSSEGEEPRRVAKLSEARITGYNIYAKAGADTSSVFYRVDDPAIGMVDASNLVHSADPKIGKEQRTVLTTDPAAAMKAFRSIDFIAARAQPVPA